MLSVITVYSSYFCNLCQNILLFFCTCLCVVMLRNVCEGGSNAEAGGVAQQPLFGST